jgi:hypothetical protein
MENIYCERLIVTQLVEKLLASYGIRRLITGVHKGAVSKG